MKNKILSLLVPVLSFLPLLAFGQGGPQTFTGNQYPLYFATQTTTSQASSNANEIVLYQVSLPRFVAGNQGYLKVTTFYGSPDATAGTVIHNIKCYLGGTNASLGAVWGANGLTPGTPVFTNSFTTTAAAVLTSYLLPNNNAFSNYVWSTTTTNSLAVPDGHRLVTYGLQTNGINLTITGVTTGPGSAGPTNVVNLDGVIIEALIQ